jgi:hypothetical protein
LSVMLSDAPLVAPVATGEKMTPIMHDAPPGAKVLPQVVAGPESTVYSALFVETLVMLIAPPGILVLLLVTFTNSSEDVPCITLPNWSEVGKNTGAESVPIPLSEIVEGLFLASLVTVRLPGLEPCTAGVKVTPMVHAAGGGVGPIDPVGPRILVLQVPPPMQLVTSLGPVQLAPGLEPPAHA